MGEKGSALPSALFLLLLLSAFLLRFSSSAKYQISTQKMFQQGYLADTMILMAEQDWQRKRRQPNLSETFSFNTGKVEVQRTSSNTVQFVVFLNDGSKIIRDRRLPENTPEEREETEEGMDEKKEEEVEVEVEDPSETETDRSEEAVVLPEEKEEEPEKAPQESSSKDTTSF